MKTEESERTAKNGSSSSRNNVEVTKNKNRELLKKKNGCQSFLFSFFLFTFLFSFSLLVPPTSGQYQVYRQDPFAMLSATLQVISFIFFYLSPVFVFCLYPFKSLLFVKQHIVLMAISFFIDILYRLTKKLHVMDRQSTLIALQEQKLQFNLFNMADQLHLQRQY